MQFSEDALQKVREDRLLIDEVDRWIFSEVEPYLGQRVLDIGCGFGNFTRHLVNRELYVGIETSRESISYLRERYQTYPTAQFLELDATSPAVAELGRFQFDTVFSLNVFEHIEDDRRALANAVRVLQRGGRTILVVPAHGWLYGTMDKAIGHYRRYNKPSMTKLFHDSGLSAEMQKYLNVIGGLGWFVNGRILRRKTPPSGQLRLFNRLVPVMQRAERVLPAPFGVSLISVGRAK